MNVTRSQKLKNEMKKSVQSKPADRELISDEYHMRQNPYTSIDGAVGGLNISSDYISCSETESKLKEKKKKKNKKQVESEKITKPKGRPPKKIPEQRSNSPIFSVQSLKENVFDNPSIHDLWANIKSLQSSVIFISQQYDELIKKNDITLKENRSLKFSQNNIQDDIVLLKKENERLSLLINQSEQEKLEGSIVLKSLPQLNNIESKEVLVNVATKLNVNLELQDVNAVQKLPLKANHKFDYVFQLKSCNTKNAIIDKNKNIKMVLKKDLTVQFVDSFDGVPEPRIFITNHMTPFNYSLFKKAKLLHHYGFRYVWYKFGKIFARESNNSNIIRIVSLDLVDDLILQKSNVILNNNTNTTIT